MHERAEHRIAAHWGYKEAPQHSSGQHSSGQHSSGRGARSTDEIAWLQRIMDWERETPDPQEFLETLKEDLEYDEVYVFTPKGEIMTLRPVRHRSTSPTPSTPRSVTAAWVPE